MLTAPEEVAELASGRSLVAGEKDVPPPRRTPGQAEGVDEESERRRPEDDALRRRRPSQSEGEDREDEADEVPREE